MKTKTKKAKSLSPKQLEGLARGVLSDLRRDDLEGDVHDAMEGASQWSVAQVLQQATIRVFDAAHVIEALLGRVAELEKQLKTRRAA